MPLTARQNFELSLRPAKLFVRLHELLRDDAHPTPDELVRDARRHFGVSETDALAMVRNVAFLGFIRPGPNGDHIDLCQDERDNLLRQAVVVCCSATECFLSSLIIKHLPTVVDLRGLDFLHPGENWLLDELSSLIKDFQTKDVLKYLTQTAAERAKWLGGMIINCVRKNYVKGDRGVRMVGRLLGLGDPWRLICGEDEKLQDAETLFERIVKRRKEIVHRGDVREHSEGPNPIEIDEVEEWVEVTEAVCLRLDDLVAERLRQFQTPPSPPPAEED